MNLVMWEYLEVNSIGIILLLLILCYMRSMHREQLADSQRYAERMILLNMGILLADNGIYLLRGHADPGLILLTHCLCIAYFLMESWFCYCWVSYTISKLFPQYEMSRVERDILLAPAMLNSLLIVASPWTGWVYSVSAVNQYHRGPFLLLCFVVVLVYWLISMAIIIQEYFYALRRRNGGEYRSLLLFPLPVLAGNILQICFYGLSVVWICAAISLLVLFVDMQHDGLSRDTLTGLYNRRLADAHLCWEVNRLPKRHDFLMVSMLDVDEFKRINDQYGHAEGDKALISVANLLRKGCRRSDCISRFGGDEFLVISHVQNREEAEGLVQYIEETVMEANQRHYLPYPVSLSIGYMICGPHDRVTMDSILHTADKNMYAAKEGKKEINRIPGDIVCS